MLYHTQILCWVLGICTWVFLLTQQAPYPVSHLSGPHHSLALLFFCRGMRVSHGYLVREPQLLLALCAGLDVPVCQDQAWALPSEPSCLELVGGHRSWPSRVKGVNW